MRTCTDQKVTNNCTDVWSVEFDGSLCKYGIAHNSIKSLFCAPSAQALLNFRLKKQTN